MERTWLTCQNGRGGRKDIFLAQDADNYYVIYAYESLNRKKRNELTREGVSDDVLKKLEAKYDKIPKSNIRAIAIGGYCIGDSVYLYPQKGSRMGYQLRVNHEKVQVDEFFGNMPRFEAPMDKKKEKWNDQAWRREARDQALFEKCRWVPWILSIFAILFSVGFMKNQNIGWFSGCLISVAVSVLLTILYPSYFTLIKGVKGKKKTDEWDLEIPLLIHVVALVMMPSLNWINDWLFLKVSVLCGAAAVIILLLFSQEFQREKDALLLAFFIAGMAGYLMVGQANRILDDTPAREYVVVAEDVYKKSGKGTSYRCVVTLPEYGEMNFHISRSLYEQLADGDDVLVVCRDGALGIEYANVYALE